MRESAKPWQLLERGFFMGRSARAGAREVVLAYFECPGNPAGPDTLAKYKDIVCGEDEHKEGIVPMVLGLLVSRREFQRGVWVFRRHFQRGLWVFRRDIQRVCEKRV